MFISIFLPAFSFVTFLITSDIVFVLLYINFHNHYLIRNGDAGAMIVIIKMLIMIMLMLIATSVMLMTLKIS